MMCNIVVKDFIQNDCTFLGEFIYNPKRHGFDGKRLNENAPGVYFFVIKTPDNKISDVLKVGKAEGKKGIGGRLQDYCGNYSKSNDPTARLFYRKLADKTVEERTISVYYKLIPVQEYTIVEGFKVKYSPVRAVEKEMSILARQQNCSMFLSRQD